MLQPREFPPESTAPAGVDLAQGLAVHSITQGQYSHLPLALGEGVALVSGFWLRGQLRLNPRATFSVQIGASVRGQVPAIPPRNPGA